MKQSEQDEDVVYRFGRAELDTGACELRIDGAVVPLQPRAFDFLTYLIRHRDRVVSKDELLASMWGDVVVNPAVLPRCVWHARQALASGGLEDAVRTFSKRGYRFVAAVETRAHAEALEATDRVMSPAMALGSDGGWGSFLGRDDERRLLDRALTSALSGSGRTVVIKGEPGIGKTRLLEVVARDALQRGAWTVWGPALEDESTPAYWPFIQLLRELSARCDRETFDAAVGESASDIASLVPELRATLGHPPAPPESDAEHTRFRLFDALVSFLRRLSTHRPLVLLLDDLQWADPGSLRILELLARTIHERSLLILATVRDERFEADRPIARLLGTLSTLSSAEVILLDGLEEALVGRLIEERTGVAPDPEIVHEVRRVTGGNPFFVSEISELYGRVSGSPEARNQATFEVPDRIRDATQRRISALSPPCRATLRVAAIVGPSFDLAMLEAVVEEKSEALLRALDEAVAVRLISEDEGMPGTFRFAHPLIREATLTLLGPSERARLHLRVAQAIDGRFSDEKVESLAFHYVHAAALGAHDAAVRYSARAGRRAMQRFGFEQAEMHFRNASALLARYAPDRTDERCEYLLATSEALRLQGAPKQRIHAPCLESAELAREANLPTLFARSAMGFTGLGAVGDPFRRASPESDSSRYPILEDALAMYRTEDALRARLLARLAETLYAPNKLDERRRLSDEAVRIAERLGDVETSVAAHLARGVVLADELDRLEERLERAEELLPLVQAGSMPWLEIELRVQYTNALLAKGAVEAADRHMAEVERVCQRWHGRPTEVRILAWNAMREAMRGSFTTAFELNREFSRIAATAFPGGAESSRLQRLCFGMAIGEIEDFVHVASRIDRTTYGGAAWKAGLAYAFASSGRLDEARRELDRLGSQDFAEVPKDEVWLVAMAYAADTCGELGIAAHADVLLLALTPYAERFVTVGSNLFCEGSLERPLARLASVLDRRDEAAVRFERALERHRSIDARRSIVLTAIQYARHLAANGLQSNRARTLLEEALRKAEDMGLTHLAQQAHDLQAQLSRTGHRG